MKEREDKKQISNKLNKKVKIKKVKKKDKEKVDKCQSRG